MLTPLEVDFESDIDREQTIDLPNGETIYAEFEYHDGCCDGIFESLVFDICKKEFIIDMYPHDDMCTLHFEFDFKLDDFDYDSGTSVDADKAQELLTGMIDAIIEQYWTNEKEETSDKRPVCKYMPLNFEKLDGLDISGYYYTDEEDTFIEINDPSSNDPTEGGDWCTNVVLLKFIEDISGRTTLVDDGGFLKENFIKTSTWKELTDMIYNECKCNVIKRCDSSIEKYLEEMRE